MRATKLLDRPARNENGEADYQVIYRSDEDMLGVLDDVPISYIILHTTTTDRPYQHHALIEHLLAGHPEQWEKIYESRRVLEQPHDIEIYRCRKHLRGVRRNTSPHIRYRAALPVSALGVESATC